MPQVFSVTEPAIEVQVITVKNDESSIWQRNGLYPAYHVTFERNGTSALSSMCIPYDATDRDMEELLRPYCRRKELAKENKARHHDNVFGYMAEIDEGEGGDCVTVTRREDAVVAPNGYIYSIYFTGESVKNLDIPQISLNFTSRPCNTTDGMEYREFNTGNGETVSIETEVQGYSSTALLSAIDFTKDELPISPIGSPTAPGKFLGNEGELLSVYKISGHYWTVEFDTNLGDLSPMTLDASGLNSAAKASVQDDTVIGVLPDSYGIDNLLTGVPYYSRVMARNSLGFSNYSDAVTKTAAERPPAPSHLDADYALDVNEVQTITTAATHVDEVQVVTTTADFIPEVQEVTISAPEDGTIAGNFSLRFPEIQVVTLSAGSTIHAGGFELNFTAVNFEGYRTEYDPNGLVFTTQGTTCIPFDASAAYVEEKLERLDLIDDVVVTRSGNGGAAYDYGYSWTISFVGNLVAGNVQLLDPGRWNNTGVSHGADSFNPCIPWDLATDDVVVTAESINDGEALGTDTEIQTVNIVATSRISQGEYKLKLVHANATQYTDCISWDASGAELEAAIENMTAVDSVRVDRSGSADSSSDYGYLYSIFSMDRA